MFAVDTFGEVQNPCILQITTITITLGTLLGEKSREKPVKS